MTSKIPILLYHNLESVDCPNDMSSQADRDTVVHVGSFEEQIKYLKENNYDAISIRELFLLTKERGPLPPGKIIITFDDGHYSNYRLAYPILLKYGFTGTFFIIGNKVGKPNYLTPEQIREMLEHGMEMGSHSLTHSFLPDLKIEEIEQEFYNSKRILESITGKPVDFFAYPGGHYNRIVLNLLQQSGYHGACSCLQGLNSSKTSQYLLKRIEIRSALTLVEFKNFFNPLNIAFHQSIDLVKNLLKKTIGLNAYSNIRRRYYKYYIFKR